MNSKITLMNDDTHDGILRSIEKKIARGERVGMSFYYQDIHEAISQDNMSDYPELDLRDIANSLDDDSISQVVLANDFDMSYNELKVALVAMFSMDHLFFDAVAKSVQIFYMNKLDILDEIVDDE